MILERFLRDEILNGKICLMDQNTKKKINLSAPTVHLMVQLVEACFLSHGKKKILSEKCLYHRIDYFEEQILQQQENNVCLTLLVCDLFINFNHDYLHFFILMQCWK